MGSDESKNIPQEDLNKILLKSVPYGWSKQAIMIRFDFEREPFRDVLELFKRM